MNERLQLTPDLWFSHAPAGATRAAHTWYAKGRERIVFVESAGFWWMQAPAPR